MAEYIDKLDAIDIFKQFKRRKWISMPIEQVIEIISAVPYVEVEPVKHGKWNNVKISVLDNSSAECSLCGAIVYNNFSDVINYCPNCGADMRPQEEVHYIPTPEWLKGGVEEID